MLIIKEVTQAGKELNCCIELFKEYAQELNENLCFQSFDDELINPLKKYSSPKGCLLLAYYNNKPVACVALQDITGTTTSHVIDDAIVEHKPTCEMKRLFVQQLYRKHKIGQALVNAIVERAKALHYTSMKLDTLEKLQPAIQLYLKNGFSISNAYYNNPLPNVVYMERSLI